MRNIYGLKMLTLNDIVLNTGGRPANAVINQEQLLETMESMSDDEKYIIDTGIKGNLPIFNLTSCYKFVFSPMELVEAIMIQNKEKKEFLEPSKLMMSESLRLMMKDRINKINKIVDEFRDKLLGDNLLTSPNYMFVYNLDLQEKKPQLYVAIPVNIIKILTTPQTYVCNICGQTEVSYPADFDRFIPDFYYRADSDKISYFCSNHKTKDCKHLGD